VTAVIGTRQLRKEDPALLTGEARFTDDVRIAGALSVRVVRSPVAHARIRSIDTGAAARTDGVVAALTGADLRDEWAAPLPCAWTVTPDMRNPEHLPVSVGEVRHAGEAVAVVVADTPAHARDAAEAVVVDYEELPVVTDLEDALADRTLVHAELGTNTSYVWELTPDPAALEQAFEAAAHVVRERYVQQRLIPMAMEPRSVTVVPEPFGGDITIYSSTQVPHFVKIFMAIVCGLPEQKIRVITPAVGGGFGSKLEVYAEEALCVALARRLGRPVHWNEERGENTQATIQGRGQIQEIELAADADGKVTAVRARVVADMGAYLQIVTPGVPLLGAFLYAGLYDVPNYSFTCTGVFTNKTPTDAYRGAGRPEATYAIERAMDALAAKAGIDPAEIRRRNFIPADAFPYSSSAGLVLDSGNYEPALDKALAAIGYDDVRAEQRRRRDAGERRHLGVGLSSYVEMCGLAPSRVLASLSYAAGGWEAATVRVLPTGKVQVVTGTTPHGQGHETVWSQIVADKLGVPVDDIDVLWGDTTITPLGLDTYGSRSLAVGGTAVHLAAERVLEKARALAAHQLECAEDDLEYVDGAFQVKGTPTRAKALGELAFAAFSAHDLPDGMEPTLEGQIVWDPPNFTFPFGVHVAVVEVDEDTGEVELVRYLAVDDCGNQVNPLIVEGQVHGGVVQGIAQALWEEAVYDADGNLLTASLMDYLVPSAADVPPVQTDHTVTPSPTNPLGVKGIGEAGTIAATPAVVNAIVDALGHLGITDIDMPASPRRVWQAIQSAKMGASA
jgi:carbon-monoxide dehydrogenase large subunit